MGHINESNGVTLIVEKQDLSVEMEQKIKNFIKKSKVKIRSSSKACRQQRNNNAC